MSTTSTPPLTFDFVAPSRIVFGWGRRVEAGALARSLGQRAFVVSGSRTLELSGGLEEILRSLRDAGVEPVRVATISREPLVDDVDACVAALREGRAGSGDLLLAVGGGSAIDLAKAAAALVMQEPAGSVREYLEGVGTGRKIVHTPLPVLAMPTTAGTGSEATKNAVISSHDPPFKKSLRSELMVPRIVLVDPELAVSVPPHITAWTGMDAITQLIESYLSRRATPATQRICLSAMNETVASLVTAFREGRSREARERMALAALTSGITLANSGLGMAHGVAAALGVHCQVPHGLACAVMLPAAMRTNLDDEATKKQFFAMASMIISLEKSTEIQMARFKERRPGAPISFEEFHALGVREHTQAAIARIDTLLDELKIPRRLSEIGVKREQIPVLVRDSRGNSMSGNPREISDEELTRILEEMF